MQYAQRLLATLPVTRAGLRAILAVLTAFGIVLATAGVAAMPLLNAGNVVEDYESGSACHPIARMVYPEGQSAPDRVQRSVLRWAPQKVRQSAARWAPQRVRQSAPASARGSEG